MKKHISILLILIGSIFSALVSKADTIPALSAYDEGFQKDILTRAYITPQRVVWKTANSVKNEEVLLTPGKGQAELFRKTRTSLTTTASDTASIILDYGKELHGGLQLVTAGRGGRYAFALGNLSANVTARSRIVRGGSAMPPTIMPSETRSWNCRWMERLNWEIPDSALCV